MYAVVACEVYGEFRSYLVRTVASIRAHVNTTQSVA